MFKGFGSVLGFREYRELNDRPKLSLQLRLREAEGDRNRDVDMPVPSMVMSLCRNMPAALTAPSNPKGTPRRKKGDPVPPAVETPNSQAVYARTVQWVYTRGLYEASILRDQLCARANEELKDQLKGEALKPHEIYSRAAHEYWEKNGVDLKGFYDRTYGKNPLAYEPKRVVLSFEKGADKGKVVSLPDVNAQIVDEDLPPFHYGGYDGLIEYIETGYDSTNGQSWMRPSYPSTRFNRAHDDRIGLSVSNPQVVGYDEADETLKYTFSDFAPPTTQRIYNSLVDRMAKYSESQVEKAMRGEPVDIADVTDKKLFERISKDPSIVKKAPYRGEEFNAAVHYGYNINKESELKDYGKLNPKDFHAIAFLVSLGLEAVTDDKSLYNMTNGKPNKNFVDTSDDEVMAKILKKVFPGSPSHDKYHVRPLILKPLDVSKSDDKRYTKSLINFGANRLKQIAQDPQALDRAIQDYANGRARAMRLIGIVPKNMANYDEEHLRQEIGVVAGIKPSNDRDFYSLPPAEYAKYAKRLSAGANVLLTSDRLKELESQDYEWIDDPHFSSRGIHSKDADKLTKVAQLRNRLTGDVITLRSKKIDAKTQAKYNLKGMYQWFMVDPDADDSLEDLDRSQLMGRRPVGLSGQKLKVNANVSELIHSGAGEIKHLIDKMKEDPEGYGFDSNKDINKELDSFFQKAATIASKRYNEYEKGNTRWQDFQGDVDNGLLKSSGSYAFRFGSLDRTQVRDEITKALGGDEDKANQVLDQIHGWIGERLGIEDIRRRLGVYPGVFNVLAKNGKQWRLNNIAQYAIEVQKQLRSQGYGGGGEDGGGEEDGGMPGVDKSVYNAMDLDDSPDNISDDEFLGREKEYRPDVEGERKQQITKRAGTPFLRRMEVMYRKNPSDLIVANHAYDQIRLKLQPYVTTSSGGRMGWNALQSIEPEANAWSPRRRKQPPHAIIGKPPAVIFGNLCAIGDHTHKVVAWMQADPQAGNVPNLTQIADSLSSFADKYGISEEVTKLRDEVLKVRDRQEEPSEELDATELSVKNGRMSPVQLDGLMAKLIQRGDTKGIDSLKRLHAAAKDNPAYAAVLAKHPVPREGAMIVKSDQEGPGLVSRRRRAPGETPPASVPVPPVTKPVQMAAKAIPATPVAQQVSAPVASPARNNPFAPKPRSDNPFAPNDDDDEEDYDDDHLDRLKALYQL